jgi:hypothetical protein
VARYRLQLLAAGLSGALFLIGASLAQAANGFDVGPGDLGIATSGEGHLPAWVQVATARGQLYPTDTGSDLAMAALPRNTFLRVLGGGKDRLHVQAYDDSGQPGQSGWVEADQVLPSAPATDWLVASSTTSLWSAADERGQALRTLDRFTPLQKIDGPIDERVLVRVYRSDFSGVVDQGWMDAAATGPALPPQARVAEPADHVAAGHGGDVSQQAFLSMAAQAARGEQALTGVPASVTVAQAILESDWGRSELARDANNYFGMKAIGTLGNDGVVWLPTAEYDDAGELYQTVSAFRAYKSLADSLADHDRLLQTASRYAAAMQVTGDPRQFAESIAEAGYSTDPDYADKLVGLMDRYDLYRLDS